jgi:hypothetical protein
MGHVVNADRMANSYMASRRTWKWTKKLFFHLLDVDIVNSYILLSSCGGKKSHTEIFDSPLSERCWHGLGMSHDHPCLWGDQPNLLPTSEDLIQVIISTGLAAVRRNADVASVKKGA